MSIFIGCALAVISAVLAIGGLLASIDPRSGEVGLISAGLLVAGAACIGWGVWG